MTYSYNRRTFEGVAVIADGARETDVTIGAAAAQTAALSEGFYDINATINCYIKIATTANTVTTTTGYKLIANNVVRVFVPNNYKIGVISSGAAGTLEIYRAGA